MQPLMSSNDSLLIALFAATVVHVLVILGLHFTLPLPEKTHNPLEITFASLPTKKTPRNAKFLAPDNQQSAGQQISKPTPPQQKTPSQGKHKNQKPAPRQTSPKAQANTVKKLITQRKAVEIIVTKTKPTPVTTRKTPKISIASLKKQIAQLGEAIRHSKPSSEKSQIKFVNSVSAHKSIAAQYQKDWEQKVERVGNLNFPAAAKKKNFSSSLTMDVGINANGSIAGISIIKSSGNKALDAAAKQIVIMSAPFPALPRELLEELDVLRIRRVWHFSEETGLQ